MDCNASTNLPVIKFTGENLKPGTSSWSLACNEIRQALEEQGCFLAVDDKICSELNDIIYITIEELFDLPTETKLQYTSDNLVINGYLKPIPQYPVCERMGFNDATNLEEIERVSNLLWPAGNDCFCETMSSYIENLSKLEQMVSRMVFESYGVEKYYDDHIGSITYFLRLSKYRVPQMNESNHGMAVHSDKSFLTILHQNQVEGLEVKTKDGWILVDFPPSSFIVLAGDALTAWSNGRVHSPLHRVVMSSNEDRYSVGLFAYKKGTIHIPEELVDEEHPRQFKSFDHFGYLDFILKNVDMNKMVMQKEINVKDYCGV